MKSVFTIIIIVLLMGCPISKHELRMITGTGDWGSVTNGLKCRVTTDRQEYRISEPVRVLVEVFNAGSQPVSFGWAEVYLSAIQGDRENPPYFFSTTLHEFSYEAESGGTVTLNPGDVWQQTVVVRPWGPTYSSSPSVASPGTMTIEASFVYRPNSTEAGQSVQSSVTIFEAKKRSNHGVGCIRAYGAKHFL